MTETKEIRPLGKERLFRGIRDFEVTSSAWLFNPEQAFAVTHRINSERPEDRWIGIEIYPTVSPKILKLAKRLGIPFVAGLTPDQVTPDRIKGWQKEHPNTKVSRVHLEFSFDPWETYLHRPLIGEHFKPPKEAIKQRVFQLAWIFFFGPATSRRGIKLAEALPVGVNAHTNVIEGFAKRGELGEIRRKVAFILAENERPYRSPHLRRKGLTSQQLASDPEVIKREFVQRYSLDGLVLGVDHAIENGMRAVEELEKTKDVVRAIHLASGKKGEGTHAFVRIGDPQIQEFLEEAAKTTFNHQVSAALDYNPFDFKAMPFEEQVRLLKETFAWLEKSQQK